jgi:hypothetical protein
MRASEIARRRAEPGWRVAVLDEQASGHAYLAASERGRQRPTSAGLSERSEQCARSGRRCFALVDCSLPLAADCAGKPPTLSSLADENRVDSLLRSTAARDPVRRSRRIPSAMREQRTKGLSGGKAISQAVPCRFWSQTR